MTLARHAKGDIGADIFRLVEEPVPEPGPNQMLVKNALASLEPGLAGAVTGEDYLIPPLPIGADIPAFTVGTVISSRADAFREGDLVHIHGGWREYAVVDAEPQVPAQMRPFKLDLGRAPLESWLAMLGLSGFTAFIGMNLIAKAGPGDTVVVSAAAGAVGGMAGQMARLSGSRVIGIAGGPDKCHYVLKQLNFDDVIDYKGDNVPAALDRSCPDGIDVYFENVGGEVLNAVWPRLNTFARVPLCGQVSQYGQAERAAGPNLFEATIKRILLEGFMGLDPQHAEHFTSFQQETLSYIERQKMTLNIDIVEGLENAGSAWMGLFSGENMGKRLLRISHN